MDDLGVPIIYGMPFGNQIWLAGRSAIFGSVVMGTFIELKWRVMINILGKL